MTEPKMVDEIEREMMAWRGANGGIYTIRACAVAVSQKVDSRNAAREDSIHAALREAEAAFETIRMILIGELKEPGRLAFWRAVRARNELRALLGFADVCQDGADATAA